MNKPFFVQIVVESPQRPAPSTIAGVVYQDQNGNGVPDAGEPRASNREVWLMNGNCQRGGAPIATTVSGPDGVYRFTGSYSGSYCVGLRGANGLEDVAAAAVNPGQVVDNLHLRTAPAAAIAGWLWHDYCSFRGGEGGPVAVDGTGIWYHTVTLAVGEQRGGVNFGWDYQLN